MEADFLATGNVFKKSFITTSVYSVWVNFKPCAFIQMFLFCCWKALLKLGVNQFSSIFWVPNSGSRIFIKSFITTSVYRFSVNFKPCAFIQMYFFCCRKALLKSGVNQFSSIFSVPNSGSIFLASGNRVFIKYFITTIVYGFWVNFKPCAFIQTFFFCYWKALLKLRANQFSSIFSLPKSGSSFSA